MPDRPTRGTASLAKRIFLGIALGITIISLMGCLPEERPGPAKPTVTPNQLVTPLATLQSPTAAATQPAAPSEQGPAIRDILSNLAAHPQGRVPQYGKLEITFQIDTGAQNLQMPYDPAPPDGVEPGFGISVDALFSPDNWRTIYTQPAFYYQEYLDEVREGREWFYPAGNYSWKVRFAPNQAGDWQYKLRAQDSNGITETEPRPFAVVDSEKKGFIRVSQNDSRYFEYENGAYFPGLGFNMNYDRVNWINPVLDNQTNFQEMSQNGIQMIRIWLSQWGIYGSAWNPWSSIDPELHARYIGFTGLTFDEAAPGSEISMRIDAERNPCMFTGMWKGRPAVKRNTDYRIRIQYKTDHIQSPSQAGQPYGFVVKTGGWLWGPEYCNEPGTGSVVSPYQNQNTGGWQILEGRLNSGEKDFLPNLYFVMENVDQGKAFIDYIWIEEDLGDGYFGPNIVSKPWMAHHLYMEQRNSYAFDKVVELAEMYDIYLRPVIMEKNDWIFQRFNFEGEPILSDPLCWDGDPESDPPQCPSSKWFYGNGREASKVRWLQQAWWRYLQARWGYSTQIHSWELLNEGDPADERHYILADEFGKYMHQFKPNDHLVSTSFWHSFPKDRFWANPEYPNIDFADIHQYVLDDEWGFYDTALATYELSMKIGARQPGGTGKPTIRGEVGFAERASGSATEFFEKDSYGVWLHNFIWGGINPGGLIESLWYENQHIYKHNRDGSLRYDFRGSYRSFYDFIKDIPLNNGHYQDADAMVSNRNLRAWGQKDLVNGRAHLWVQNIEHHWNNLVDGNRVSPASGSIAIAGFQPGANYLVQWWDTYATGEQKQVIRSQTITAQTDGSITISFDYLDRDLALKIELH